jgi:hypothetical protein
MCYKPRLRLAVAIFIHLVVTVYMQYGRQQELHLVYSLSKLTMRASLVLSLLFTSISLTIPLFSPATHSLLYNKRADDELDTKR